MTLVFLIALHHAFLDIEMHWNVFEQLKLLSLQMNRCMYFHTFDFELSSHFEDKARHKILIVVIKSLCLCVHNCRELPAFKPLQYRCNSIYVSGDAQLRPIEIIFNITSDKFILIAFARQLQL